MSRITRFSMILGVLLVLGPIGGQAADITSAKQAILIDASTGQVLFARNENEPMPTSSMSKVMTMYMVFDALKSGRLNLEDKLPVSAKAWQKGGSKMFVEVGSEVKVEDLIRGVIVQSGNDATIVLAEALGGSEENFAQAMTEKAHQIGMTASQFKNASGWPDPEHYSTARDLAVLSLRTIYDFPEYYAYYAEKEFTYNGIKQPNRNPLLFREMGVDGIKTGHTEVGGYGLMASGVRDSRRLVLVLNGLESEKSRAQEAARLLEWGFVAFENVKLFDNGATVETANVWLGAKPNVPLVVAEDVRVTLPRADKNKLQVAVRYSTPLAAPIEKNQPVAKLLIKTPGVDTVREIDLLAGEAVPKLGFFSRGVAKMKYILLGDQ